jgi:hypothetical protein
VFKDKLGNIIWNVQFLSYKGRSDTAELYAGQGAAVQAHFLQQTQLPKFSQILKQDDTSPPEHFQLISLC